MGKKTTSSKKHTQLRAKSLSQQRVQTNLQEISAEADPTLKLLWVDKVNVVARSDAPVITLNCYSALPPNRLIESCHIQMSVTHAKKLGEVILQIISQATKRNP